MSHNIAGGNPYALLQPALGPKLEPMTQTLDRVLAPEMLPAEGEACDAWCQATAYVSPVLADAFLSPESKPSGWIEPVEGTLLVADVSGFTTISERLAGLGPEGAEL